MQFCGSLSILWHCLSLGLESKTDLFQSCGPCWVFQICWHIECSTFTASSFRIWWNSPTGIPSIPLALFIVMLSKAHLTSYSRMSGSRWVITPLWLSGTWRSFLYYRWLECKSRKSRNTWGNRQIWPWNMDEAGQRLIEFCQENTLVIANTVFQQHKKGLYMDIPRWSTLKSDWLCSLQPKIEKLYTVSKERTERLLQLRSKLLIAKFRLKIKKVGKTTRPFRYDLNQIPYDYTVEVRNRFKGLDLIECLMNYGMRFMTLYRRQGSRPSPWKRNAKKQNGCLGRPYK